MEDTLQRFFLEIAYDGTGYHGWQVQDNAVSVQQKLNEALHQILRYPIETIGAGRTDTGVHAKQLFIHLDIPKDRIQDESRFLHSLNSLLPPDIPQIVFFLLTIKRTLGLMQRRGLTNIISTFGKTHS